MSGTNGKHNGNGHDPDDEDNIVRMPSLAERDRIRRAQEKELRAQYRASNPREPMINLPPITKYMIGCFLLIHVITSLLFDKPTQFLIIDNFGFTPGLYSGTIDFKLIPGILGPITYAFLHGSWIHIGMNSVMLAAFGSGVERWLGGKRLLVLFFTCSLAATIVHFALSPFSEHTMIGASGGVSGLFAAVLIMLQMEGRLAQGKYGIWPFALIWIVVSFIFGMMGGPDGSAIAWAAHIGGFLAGLIFLKPIITRIK